MFHTPIKHCRNCGSAVVYRLPDDGDTRERAVCTHARPIHYENPLNVVGTVPHLGDQVLLCKRNIEPRKGKWTLPAGFMELDETTAQGAARETVEEAGAQFEMESLFAVLNVARVGQVHLFYTARLLADQFRSRATRRWRHGCSPRPRSPGTRSPFEPSRKRWSTTSTDRRNGGLSIPHDRHCVTGQHCRRAVRHSGLEIGV